MRFVILRCTNLAKYLRNRCCTSSWRFRHPATGALRAGVGFLLPNPPYLRIAFAGAPDRRQSSHHLREFLRPPGIAPLRPRLAARSVQPEDADSTRLCRHQAPLVRSYLISKPAPLQSTLENCRSANCGYIRIIPQATWPKTARDDLRCCGRMFAQHREMIPQFLVFAAKCLHLSISRCMFRRWNCWFTRSGAYGPFGDPAYHGVPVAPPVWPLSYRLFRPFLKTLTDSAARMKLRWKTCGQEVSSGSAFICAGPGVEMPHPCYWSEEIVLRGERSALSVPGTRRYSASMSNLNGRLYKRRPEWLLRRAPQTQSVVEHPHSEKACRSPHQTRTEHPYTAD